jgi:hypothetical protein
MIVGSPVAPKVSDFNFSHWYRTFTDSCIWDHQYVFHVAIGSNSSGSKVTVSQTIYDNHVESGKSEVLRVHPQLQNMSDTQRLTLAIVGFLCPYLLLSTDVDGRHRPWLLSSSSRRACLCRVRQDLPRAT